MAQKSTYRFEQFFATRRTMGFTPMPDGESLLVITDISGQLNLWRVPTAGGWPEQLTLFDRESVRDVRVSKDGSRIAFIADLDGNEHYQVYLMDVEGGWPEQITNQPKVDHTLGGFSPDGRYLAYAANADPAAPQDVNIYLRDLQTGDVRMICGGGGIFYVGHFSPDGRQILAVQFYANTNQDIWLIDVGTGRRENLTAHPDRDARFFPVAWQKEGKGFYYVSNEGRAFTGTGYYDLTTRQREWFLTFDWDVEDVDLSPDGTLGAYVVNEAGNSALHLYDMTSRRELASPSLPRGVIAGVMWAEKDAKRRLFLWMGTYRSAGTLFALDIERGELTQVTQPMLGNIPAEVFVQPEPVTITSFDGLEVPAWLYRPHGIQPGERVPAVLAIHGGPEAQERTGYNYGGFYQYLLSRGIAILAPNVRGSTGFGIEYQVRIHRDWGGDELQDIEACARYLQSLEWVDSNRLGVWGGSFGGFATLSAASRLPSYWAAACDFCGPANLVTFVQSVPPHWKPMMKKWIGDAEEDRDLLMERSPITYVEQIQAPLMVVQGANDPRVVQAESDQMVERLRSMGRHVEYLVFDDEGHGFTKRPNQLKGYRAMADFLIKHLDA